MLDVVLGNLPWHGTLDPVTPMPVLQQRVDDMPPPVTTIYADEGHAIGFTHARDILSALT